MTTNYLYTQLDLRPQGAEANDVIFASGSVLGVEVTIPDLAKRCELGNIDPQHSGFTIDVAAIEAAMKVELPKSGAVLTTVKPDLDSIGAMAVIAIRRDMAGDVDESETSWDWLKAKAFLWKPEGEIAMRLQSVIDADVFAVRGHWESCELPSRENPWPSRGASVESSPVLAAMAAAVADFKVPIAQRVEWMKTWILTGEEPDGYRDKVVAERTDMIKALETGEIQYSVSKTDSRIAVVESTHRAATLIGYSLAPVVVALNPEFRIGGGDPHRKFTVCAFDVRYADIKSALGDLANMEAGWGGGSLIGGSPQGVNSTLTVGRVVDVLSNHLKVSTS